MRSAKPSPFIAVVDDSLALREAIQSLLGSAGYRTQGYASAEAFLCCRLAQGAACLILDAKLPGISGHELQRALCLAHNPVPVIFISAHDELERELRARALQWGALAFLRKPFGGEELLRVVRNAVQLRDRRHPASSSQPQTKVQ
jgi:FixJ family two-component response regulator